MVVSPTWPILVIISGLPELVGLTQPITEIRRRCRYISFASLNLPDDIAMIEAMAKSLAELAAISLVSTETEALIPRLIHAGLYQMGIAIELIQEAIGIALKNASPSLALTYFGDAYTARTRCDVPGNPFITPDWANTDCTLVLNMKSDDDDVAEIETPAERRARKKIGKNKVGKDKTRRR